MREADILQSAIKKAEQNGYNFSEAKIGVFYIFTHEFAKAFWGRKNIETEFLDNDSVNRGDSVYNHIIMESWEYHLQKMVLEPEPLKYLESFL